MNKFETLFNEKSQELYAILRIAIAFLFLCHGAQKLFGAFGGHALSSPLMIAAGIIEFFGGILIGIGFKVRYIAFITAGEMAVAYFLRHAPQGLWPISNGGEKAVFYFFIFLFMTAYGSGIWSVDILLKKE